MPGRPLPELLFSAGQVRWRAALERGRRYGFVAPPGVAAVSLRQRLLEGLSTDRGLRWSPPLATGMAVLSAEAELLSNLQVWENILLPWHYHQRGPRPDAEHDLRRWLAALLGVDDAESWLHRPVGRLGEVERRAAILLRALAAPASVVVVAADFWPPLPPERAGRWPALLIDEIESQRRTLLYLEAVSKTQSTQGFEPLEWVKD